MSEDKPKLTLVNESGNENPWYVMMTIAGEQDEVRSDAKLHEKNRRYWNGWAAQALSEEQKNKLIAEGRATAEDLARLTDKENEFINSAIKSRCPKQELRLGKHLIDFINNEFPNYFCCEGFVFPYMVLFNKATFGRMVDFNKATFGSIAYFEEARFLRWVWFKEATFSNFTFFNKAIFSERAYFSKATFESKVEFQNSKFKSATKFNNAKFLKFPPEFYNATLHEDTDWTDIKWPKAPEKREWAEESRRAYERLKLIMAQQNKFSDEYFFLRKELRCREIENPICLSKKFGWREIKHIFLLIKTRRWRKVEKVVSLATLFSYFYRWFSDYGWSVGRPLFFLSAVWFIGFLSIYGIEIWGCKCINFWQSMGISAYNTFPFFHDTYFPKDISLSRPSIIVSGLQTVLGLVFLFLFGLGLRNRFRIK